jgi:hypothetical protein
MSDKTCPYFGIAPASFMRMGYCKIKSNEKDLTADYHFVACTSNEWDLCPIILDRQRKKLEKELEGF